MTEQDTKNTTTSNDNMCNKCGHHDQHPCDQLYNDGGKTQRVPHRVNASSLLRVLGLVAILEGFLCLVAAYVDQTWGVLPTDPLTILGVACMMAGLILTAGGLLTYPTVIDQACDLSRSTEQSIVDELERRSMPTSDLDGQQVGVVEDSVVETDNKKDR